MGTYLALCLLGLLVPVLPVSLGHRLASLLGTVCYYLQTGARRNVIANLRRVLGEEARPAALRATALSIFRTGALNYYDLFRVPRLSLAELERIIEVQGWEHFDAARRAGRGVIAVLPHVGNMDVVAQVVAVRGVPTTIPVERVRPERLLKLVTRIRASRGIKIVPIDGSAAPARMIYKALRGNHIVGMVSDRDVLGSGLPVRFFGQVTRLPDGPVSLALRTGAPLVAAFTSRRDDGTFYMEISPPLALPRTGDSERDVRAGIELVAAAFERIIRQNPGQWVVFEPVWPADGSAVRPVSLPPLEGAGLSNGV